MALDNNPGIAIYELNPYVDLQRLLVRLMDISLLESGDTIINNVGNGATQSITRDGNSLKLHNMSPLKMNLKKKLAQILFFSEDKQKKR